MTNRIKKTYYGTAEEAIGKALEEFDMLFTQVIPSRIEAEYNDGWLVIVES